jgi:hypothetical protein
MSESKASRCLVSRSIEVFHHFSFLPFLQQKNLVFWNRAAQCGAMYVVQYNSRDKIQCINPRYCYGTSYCKGAAGHYVGCAPSHVWSLHRWRGYESAQHHCASSLTRAPPPAFFQVGCPCVIRGNRYDNSLDGSIRSSSMAFGSTSRRRYSTYCIFLPCLRHPDSQSESMPCGGRSPIRRTRSLLLSSVFTGPTLNDEKERIVRDE